MIEATVADVVGPSVAADDPDTFLYQHVSKNEKLFSLGLSELAQPLFQDVYALALLVDVGFVFLFCCDKRGRQIFANVVSHAAEKFLGELGLLVDRHAESEAEFSVVFEQRVGPRRPTSVSVLSPGSSRQVAAIDRRAT